MTLRRLVIVVSVAVLTATCAGSDDAPAEAPDGVVASSSVPAAALSVESVPAPAVEGEWVMTRPTFDDGGVESVEGVTMEVVAIAAAGDAYFAAGDIVGIPTIWRSVDLEHFEVVYLDERAAGRSRWMRLESIAEFGDRVVVGGRGEQREGAAERMDRSFLFVTDDGGDSWEEIEDPLFSSAFQRLDRLVVAGDTLLIDLVNDECCGQPVWQPHRSTDLIDFEPVVLPAADDDAWGYFVRDGIGTVFAIESRWEGDQPRFITWSSTDGAHTWDRTELPVDAGRGVAAVAGGLTVIARVDDTNVGPAEWAPRAPSRIVGADLSVLEPDVGQWGDGATRLVGLSADGSGRYYGLLGRQIRANPHFCFEDITTCHEYQVVLVTSVDGIEWVDLDHSVSNPSVRDELFVTLDGHVGRWRHPRDGELEIDYWRGPDAPPTVDPPGYAPPDAPIPMYGPGEGLAVGTERRFAWGLGGCGGMYIDDISWVPDEYPDTTGWPIEEVAIDDGPSGYAYGRVRRIAADVIEFSIEHTDVTVTFTPRVEPGPVCG